MKERVLVALSRRRKTHDSFRNDNGYSWDYLIAFRVYDETDPISPLQIKYNMQHVLNMLQAGGMEFRLFYSIHVSTNDEYCFYFFLWFRFMRAKQFFAERNV